MVCAARGEDKNATIVTVDEGKEEGWLGQRLQPKSRSSFAARYCHEERGDGREVPGSTGQVAEHASALQ